MTALHQASKLHESDDTEQIRVAFGGNPNAGKTSLFNALTGAHQHVGNYPGVTVEKRTGSFTLDGDEIELVDLPGTYSLRSFSPEERIAQEELLSGRYDVVVVVVDATALKRSLVLLAQVMQIGVRAVLCLNMSDEAQRAGQQLDLDQMRALLGVPVVETVGHRGDGVDQLKVAIQKALSRPPAAARVVLGQRLDRAIASVVQHLELGERLDTRAWTATQLLMGHELVIEQLEQDEGSGAALEEVEQQRKLIEAETGLDVDLFVTERFFGFVDGLLQEVMLRKARADSRS